MVKARFAKGALAPKGKMYFVDAVPEAADFPRAVKRGIREVCRTMLKAPVSLIGVKGIRKLARQVELWPKKFGPEKTLLYLGQVIRMQEEIGTGGAGFRFIYAAFLQQAADVLALMRVRELSEEMTTIGDLWRQFAVSGARNCKGRARPGDSYEAMGATLRECADREAALYRELLSLAS
jgi:hypothetical protein